MTIAEGDDEGSEEEKVRVAERITSMLKLSPEGEPFTSA